jgi:hypothetical protein
MAIGKLLPVLLRRYANPRIGPTGNSLPERLATRMDWAQAPIHLKIIGGLVTPPLPFAEAERKAGPNMLKHNTVLGKLPTAQIRLFTMLHAAWLSD